MKIKKTVYTKSFEDAVASGERDIWQENYKLNEACCEAINTAINVSRYDEHSYKLKNAAQDVIHKYGDKRVLWVLAATVQSSFNDGRYSRQNKEWAEGFDIPFHNRHHPTVLSHPCLVDGFIDRAKEVSAELKQARAEKRAAKAESAFEPTHFATGEAEFFYSVNGGPENDAKIGFIGRLRGDFGRSGDEFWTTWFEGCSDLKTSAFRAELDNVINSLRSNVLKDYKSMSAYCGNHPQALLSDNRPHYGFKLKTESHVYLLRCCNVKGDYNFYVSAFDRGRLEKELASRSEHKPSLLGKLAENKQKAAEQPKSEPKKNDEREV